MRRVLERIKIQKISAVDAPAQEGARALILKHAPAAMTFAEALRKQGAAGNIQGPLHVARSGRDDDPDFDGSIDDWSHKDQSKRKKKPKPFDKRKPVEHPFMQEARLLAREKKLPLYAAMSENRRARPQSYRHFVQSGAAASSRPQPMRKTAPDDAAIAWDQAVRSWSENHGVDRCTSMAEIRKRDHALFRRRFRR